MAIRELTRLGANPRKIARLLQAKAPEGHILAYITPEEADVLKARGGSGHEHEDTGIPSFEMEDAGFGGIEAVPTEPAPGPEVSPPVSTQPFEMQPPVSAAPAPAAVPAPAGGLPFRTGADVAGGLGAMAGYQPPSVAAPTTTIGGAYQKLAEGLGISPDTLGRIGIGGLQAVLGAGQARKAAAQGQAAKGEMQQLAAPYQQQGQQLVAQAQRGELTPQAQQSLQALQARAAQQAAQQGGVGVAQAQASVEAFRQQLLQQQADYGLKLSNIGDQIALGAIRAGVQADQYVNQLTGTYFNNIARTLGGFAPQAATQQQPGVA